MKRLFLALIPVALLASVSFAYPVLNPEPSSEPAPALVAGPGDPSAWGQEPRRPLNGRAARASFPRQPSGNPGAV